MFSVWALLWSIKTRNGRGGRDRSKRKTGIKEIGKGSTATTTTTTTKKSTIIITVEEQSRVGISGWILR